jgi:hypothetical protein
MDEYNKELWSWILNMTIAAYLNDEPDIQVRRMAKKYRKLTTDKSNRRTLGKIIKSSRPSLVIKVAYEELISQS